MADLKSFQLTEAEVLRALKGIDVGHGNGPDDISPLLENRCAWSLLAPLYFQFHA